MEMLFQVCGLGITVVIMATVLKKQAGEQSLLLILAFVVAVFFFLTDSILEIIRFMEELAEIAEIDQSLLAPVLKTVVISIITKITGEICRSAGEGGTASMVEFAGAVLALLLALPLIQGVMSMMAEML